MDIIKPVEEILLDFQKSLRADGGDIELLDVTDGIVKVSISRTTVPVAFSSFFAKVQDKAGECRAEDVRYPQKRLLPRWRLR